MKRLTLLLAPLALAACAIPDADPLPPEAVITSFTASASEVNVGDTVTLTWATENAHTISLLEVVSGESVPLSDSADGGATTSAEVTVNGESTWLLTATNRRGVPTTAVVNVRVGDAPPEFFFAALPATIHAGERSTLVWNAPGAQQVSLTANPGGPVNTQNQTGAGSLTLSPEQPTRYSLTVGASTRTVDLRVLPVVERFEVTAVEPQADDAGVVDAGEPGVLHLRATWQARGATRVRLSLGGLLFNEVNNGEALTQGSFELTVERLDPARVLSFELTAINASGLQTSVASY